MGVKLLPGLFGKKKSLGNALSMGTAYAQNRDATVARWRCNSSDRVVLVHTLYSAVKLRYDPGCVRDEGRLQGQYSAAVNSPVPYSGWSRAGHLPK